MTDLNRVSLIGNLGSEPEVRLIGGGYRRVCNFSIATNEAWRDKNTGEKQTRTQWHRIVVWNDNLISLIERYAQKGTRLFIEGQLQTRSWETEDGEKRYVTEVVLNFNPATIILIGNTKEHESSEPPAPSPADSFENQNTSATTFKDDDIPW